MKALITKSSDWNFRNTIEDFTLSEASLKELMKEYGDYAFVVSLDPYNTDYDIIIEIYDDYRE